MNRGAIVISLVATFLVGAALGLMGGILFAHRAHGGPGAMAFGAPPAHDHGPGRDALPRLQKLLDLTPDQVKRIEPSVLASRKLFAAARETLRVRIDAELTPAQHERWREFQRTHPVSGPTHDDADRAHRAPPGTEGEHR